MLRAFQHQGRRRLMLSDVRLGGDVLGLAEWRNGGMACPTLGSRLEQPFYTNIYTNIKHRNICIYTYICIHTYIHIYIYK